MPAMTEEAIDVLRESRRGDDLQALMQTRREIREIQLERQRKQQMLEEQSEYESDFVEPEPEQVPETNQQEE